jgi:hypothetical protein
MRDLPTEIQTEINRRDGVIVRALVWFAAKNRDTGETEYLGMWNGDDHQSFVVDGETRLYYGAGNLISVGDLVTQASLNIRMLSFGFSHITPELNQVLRLYDPKRAPIEVHLAFFSPETNNLVAPPVRMHKGWVNKFKISTPPKNDTGSATMDAVGHTRLLTKKLAARRSNENQRKRAGADTFFTDVGMTGTVTTPWGAKGVGAMSNGGGGSGAGGGGGNVSQLF